MTSEERAIEHRRRHSQSLGGIATAIRKSTTYVNDIMSIRPPAGSAARKRSGRGCNR